MKKYAKIYLIIVSFLAPLAVSPVFASVGKVSFAHGTVSVERPEPDILTEGMPVEEGDVIVTGSNGYVQLLLDDKTQIAIRPDSRFTILALEMPAGGGSPAIGAGVTPRAEFSLQKGGFQTSTGGIARTTPTAYQVSTPNAVIGIRGTHYKARLCAGDCGQTTDDGLFVGVTTGRIFLTNNGGELDLFRHQFGFARNFNTAPVRLMQPPASLQDDGLDALIDEEEEEEDDSSGGDEGDSEGDEEEAEEAAEEFGSEGEESESSEESTTDTMTAARPTSGEVDQQISSADGNDLTGGDSAATNSFSFSTSEFTLATTVGGIDEDSATSVASFRALGGAGSIERYDIGTAIPHNEGFDPVTELKWGRWSEGTASVDGSPLDLTNSSLHFIVAPDTLEPNQVITGSAEYVLVGNTDPTDNLGNVGIMGDARLLADFTSSSVQSDLLLSIDNHVFEASGTGDINGALFNGLYDTVSINGSSGGSGSFTGLFTGFAEGLPAGAGMNYNLIDGSTVVNGAVIFNRAQ